MSRFLKLTKFLFNTTDILQIVIEPNKYFIHLRASNFSGNMWQAGMIGFGTISTDRHVIEVCETAHSADYKIVSEWISSLDK
jgi:hypothetical protein